jgi:hypothetical protein
VLALWLVEPASALLSAESVRTTRAYETTPAAAEDYVAWAQAPLAARGRYVAFVKKGAAAKVRVNPVGVAFVGGLDLASRRLVYQQIYRGQSNLKFFHLDTREITNPPTGVNTGQWECCASISGDRLLFNRESLSTPTRRVMLRELAGETQLAVIRRDKYFVSADQLNGDFAVWTKCTERCNVFRRDLALMTTRVLPKPETKPPRDQFGSSVASDGTVYLVRSGPGAEAVSGSYGSGPGMAPTVGSWPGSARDGMCSLPRRPSSPAEAWRSSTTESSAGRSRPTSSRSRIRNPPLFRLPHRRVASASPRRVARSLARLSTRQRPRCRRGRSRRPRDGCCPSLS